MMNICPLRNIEENSNVLNCDKWFLGILIFGWQKQLCIIAHAVKSVSVKWFLMFVCYSRYKGVQYFGCSVYESMNYWLAWRQLRVTIAHRLYCVHDFAIVTSVCVNFHLSFLRSVPLCLIHIQTNTFNVMQFSLLIPYIGIVFDANSKST